MLPKRPHYIVLTQVLFIDERGLSAKQVDALV